MLVKPKQKKTPKSVFCGHGIDQLVFIFDLGSFSSADLIGEFCIFLIRDPLNSITFNQFIPYTSSHKHEKGSPRCAERSEDLALNMLTQICR